MTGSATPSSLIRLCRVPMFCATAMSWICFSAEGLSVAFRRRSLPSRIGELQVGLIVSSAMRALLRVSSSRKRITMRSPSRRDAAVADVLVAHQAAQVGAHRVKALGQRALHVDLEQEMHAAAQVETEVHRQGNAGWSATAASSTAG